MMLLKVKTGLRLLMGLTLLGQLAACGGQTTPEAAKDAPTAATTATAAESSPTQADKTETAIETRKPATVQEATQAIDLRQLTLPDGAALMGPAEAGALRYETAQDIASVVKAYQTELTQQDWVEDTANSRIDPTSAGLYFTKNGFTLNLSVSDMGNGKNLVSLINAGNIDLRTLPQMKDAEQISAFPNTLIYFSPSEVKAVADFTRQALTEAGWQLYTRPNMASDPNQPQQIFNLKQNGMDLSVMVSSSPAQAGKTAVQYSTTLLPFDLPIPSGVEALEFEANTLFATFRTAEKFEAVAQFYQHELGALGWLELTESAVTSKEKAARFFTHEAEELALLLELTSEDGQTVATLRSFEASELTAAATPTPETITELTPTPAAPAEAVTATENSSTFPLPTDAEAVNYGATEVTFSTPADINKVVTFYREKLAADGWTEEELFTVVDKMVGLVRFKRGEEVLAFNLMNMGMSGLTEVTVDTSQAPSFGGESAEAAPPETTSTEATPQTGPLTAEDKDGLPVPSGYTSYTSEGSPFSRKVNFSLATDMKSLFDFYEKELVAKGWKLGDIIASTFDGRLEATGAEGVLTLTAQQGDEAIEVVLVTKDKAAAAQAGILPADGLGRIYLVNPTESEVTVTLNDQEFNLPAGSGMESPETATSLDVSPKKYPITAKIDGEETTLDLEVAADEVWTVLMGPGGMLPTQTY